MGSKIGHHLKTFVLLMLSANILLTNSSFAYLVIAGGGVNTSKEGNTLPENAAVNIYSGLLAKLADMPENDIRIDHIMSQSTISKDGVKKGYRDLLQWIRYEYSKDAAFLDWLRFHKQDQADRSLILLNLFLNDNSTHKMDRYESLKELADSKTKPNNLIIPKISDYVNGSNLAFSSDLRKYMSWIQSIVRGNQKAQKDGLVDNLFQRKNISDEQIVHYFRQTLKFIKLKDKVITHEYHNIISPDDAEFAKRFLESSHFINIQGGNQAEYYKYLMTLKDLFLYHIFELGFPFATTSAATILLGDLGYASKDGITSAESSSDSMHQHLYLDRDKKEPALLKGIGLQEGLNIERKIILGTHGERNQIAREMDLYALYWEELREKHDESPLTSLLLDNNTSLHHVIGSIYEVVGPGGCGVLTPGENFRIYREAGKPPIVLDMKYHLLTDGMRIDLDTLKITIPDWMERPEDYDPQSYIRPAEKIAAYGDRDSDEDRMQYICRSPKDAKAGEEQTSCYIDQSKKDSKDSKFFPQTVGVFNMQTRKIETRNLKKNMLLHTIAKILLDGEHVVGVQLQEGNMLFRKPIMEDLVGIFPNDYGVNHEYQSGLFYDSSTVTYIGFGDDIYLDGNGTDYPTPAFMNMTLHRFNSRVKVIATLDDGTEQVLGYVHFDMKTRQIVFTKEKYAYPLKIKK